MQAECGPESSREKGGEQLRAQRRETKRWPVTPPGPCCCRKGVQMMALPFTRTVEELKTINDLPPAF